MADLHGDEYADEARRRWGGTEAFAESQRRTATYTEDDWRAIHAEGTEIESRLAAAMTSGLPAGGIEAMDAAEAHRRHIERRFYPCSTDMHRGLGAMYLADPRFTEHYERISPGLARFVHDAIEASARRGDSAA
jgi:hypothetical protein